MDECAFCCYGKWMDMGNTQTHYFEMDVFRAGGEGGGAETKQEPVERKFKDENVRRS